MGEWQREEEDLLVSPGRWPGKAKTAVTELVGGAVMATAREVMHRGAECIGENESLVEAAKKMRDLKIGSLPICGEDNRLHGIITDRDIVVKCCAEGLNPAEVKAGSLAQGTLQWVDVDTDVDQVLRLMEEHQVRRMPVLENRQLVGMISEVDLAHRIPEQKLAEFVEKVYQH